MPGVLVDLVTLSGMQARIVDTQRCRRSTIAVAGTRSGRDHTREGYIYTASVS